MLKPTLLQARLFGLSGWSKPVIYIFVILYDKVGTGAISTEVGIGIVIGATVMDLILITVLILVIVKQNMKKTMTADASASSDSSSSESEVQETLKVSVQVDDTEVWQADSEQTEEEETPYWHYDTYTM